ncbi:MAG: HAD-IIB family hydrolase [Candidatus Zambryskibacteria bacterium]|nr:HAD-IIB family hydrolase [Candidatus Zambryskibacteria bacterium]
MKFELIAFDIDGTLTRSKSPLEDNPLIDTDMSDWLNKLMVKYKVAIISGASYKQFQSQILAHLTKDREKLKNLYLLPTNGTALCVYGNGTWQCPPVNALTDSEKKEIYAAFDKMFAEVGFTIPDNVYGEIIEDRGSQITFSAFGQNAPIEIKEAWDKDHSRREQMVLVLKKYLPDFAAHIGGATSIDVTRRGIDKAYGLRELLKHLNLPREKLLYVGDELYTDGNDAPALKVAGECRAVKGPEETKKVIMELLV